MIPRTQNLVSAQLHGPEQDFDQVDSLKVMVILFLVVCFVSCLHPTDYESKLVLLHFGKHLGECL